MNKRILTLLLAGCLAFSATACKKENDSKGNENLSPTGTISNNNSSGDNSSNNTQATTVLDKLSGSATLGAYRGVEVKAIDTSVSDDEIKTELENFAYDNMIEENVTDRTKVELWDKVNINYSGKVDGVAFDGGTDDTEEGTDLILGSHSFIDGFEEAIVGFNVGDEKDITVTFPDPYLNNPDLAGKPAVFTIKVNKIVSKVTIPEVTDELVANNTDYKTVEEYRDYLKTSIEESNKTAADRELKTNAVQAVIDNSSFEGIAQKDIDDYAANMRTYYSSMASLYGLDEEKFVLYFFGMTKEQYEAEIQSASDFAIRQELIVKAIIETEKLTISNDEYIEGLNRYTEEYDYPSVEDFEKENSKEVIEEALLMDKALNIIYDNMVIVD